MGDTLKALLIGIGLLFSAVASAQSTTSACDGRASCVTDLAQVVGAMANGTMPFLATAASTATTRMDETHDQMLEERGYGLYYGNHGAGTQEMWPGAAPQDCTTFVLEILKQAYLAAGLEKEWDQVFQAAIASSGSTGFKGIELMKALQETGWTGHYWNPDVKNPGDGGDEHPWSYYLAKKNNKYYGLPVDMDRAVLDYNLSDVSEVHSSPGLDDLKEVPFAVLGAKGGQHMAVLVYGKVYEVHWTASATSKAVITDVPLEEWGWMSGAIVVPPGTWPKSGS
jgi:hypothetical protein